MALFLIACGGTGGHLSPGIALAERLQELGESSCLITSRKQIDSRICEKYKDLQFEPFPGSPFSLNPVKLVRFIVNLCGAFFHSLRLIRNLKPKGVVVFGGFMSVALIFAASICRIPIFIHEANRYPGKVTRYLHMFVAKLYLPDGVRIEGIRASRICRIGYPLRREIQKWNKDEARLHLNIPVDGKLLVILGGSQGAQSLNEWAMAHESSLCRGGIHLYCVTGLGKVDSVRRTYNTLNGQHTIAVFTAFSDAMAPLISAADLVISRAGAGSIEEIIECYAPAIFIPYPHAADQHQDYNARYIEKHGACLLVAQDQIESLYREVNDLLFNEWVQDKFRVNLKQLRKEDSAMAMAKDLIEVCQSDAHLDKSPARIKK
jgi:UDP-N-acetylglucosamine--N-acetylmuramyl-(pentapeptide) pyrophosphoryl-undecaprenol N-acetylglucosamine transferase